MPLHVKWPILKNNLALQTGFAAFIVYAILLCFQPVFPPITFAISLYWLFYVLSFRKERFSRIVKNPIVWLWVIYYLAILFGVFYSTEPEIGWKDVLLKITLLLWPLGFSSWPEPIWKYKDRLLQIFAWVISLSAMCVVVIGTWRWFESGTKLHQLFGHLNIWPMIPNHYMALYSALGLFIFIHLYRKKVQGIVATSIGIAILLTLILVTSVRIQLIAIPIAGIVFIFYDIQDRAKRQKLFVGGIVAATALIVLSLLFPSSRNRINDTIAEIKSFNGMVDDRQTNHRVFIWQYGSKVISENIWTGTGTGSADLALHEKLKECDAKFWNGKTVYYLRDKVYNYHNEYLQNFAAHGLLIFILFIIIMFLPFFMLKTEIGGIEAAFLTLCIIAFSTESMLERQAGVLFFGFFYNFFFTSKSGRLEKIITEK